MKHQIKHLYTDAVLFECDVPEDVQASGMATRYALEKAVKDDADLSGSDLRGQPVGRNRHRIELELFLEASDANLEKLVKIAADDAQKAQAFQQGRLRVACL